MNKRIFRRTMRAIVAALLLLAMMVGSMSGITWKAEAATSVKVVYNGMGGYRSTDGKQTVEVTAYTNKSITIESNFVRPGYTFQGWATSKGSTDVKYLAGQKKTFSSGATLYAVWKLDSFTIKYYPVPGNYNVYMTQEAPLQGRVTLKKNTTGATKPGYVFVGWSRKIGTTAQYTTNASVLCSSLSTEKNSTVSLYGVWRCTHEKKKQRTEIVTPQTCTKNGVKRVVCTECGKVLSTASIPAGHCWEVWAYNDENTHLVWCSRCSALETKPHEYGYQSDFDGHHYTNGCVWDGCPQHGGALESCRTLIPEDQWDYYIDTVTFKKEGKNFYLREGTCPKCGIHIIEYGYTGFVKSGKGKTIVDTIETVVTAAGIIVSVANVGGTAVTAIFTLHDIIGVLKSGKEVLPELIDLIKNGSDDEEIKGCDYSWMKNLTYMDPSKKEFENSLKAAKTYFFPAKPKNMHSAYEREAKY